MAVELPTCAICRTRVQSGQNVVFRPDGRVHHAECPKVTCPVCTDLVAPGQPIRRDGDQIIHANCWTRRLRTSMGDES